METITIEIKDDGSVRVTEDEGDQTTEPMTQEFDSVGQAAEALMEMLQRVHLIDASLDRLILIARLSR
jgi:hypothetical protein